MDRTPTENEIAAALVAVEIDTRFAERNGVPLIEETIGPAEAHGVCPRAVDAELRVMQLERDIQTERDLCMAVMRVSAQKDAEYDELMERCEQAEQIGAEWIGVFIAWVAGCGLAMVARWV